MNFLKNLFEKPADLPNDVKASINRGEFYHALTLVDRLIQRYPDRVGLYLDRAQVQIALKNWDRAIEDCNRVLSNAPDAAAYVFRGTAYNAKSEFERGIADFSKAAEFGMSLLTLVFTNRAFSYLKMKNYEGVIADCTLILALSPDTDNRWQVYLNRAMAYRYLEKYEEAIEDCTKVLSLPVEDERRFGAYYNRGAAHLGLKQYAEAAEDFSRALQINDSHFETYAYRGYVYHLLRRFDDALADIEKALRFNPRNVRVLNSRAAALQMKGAFTEALESADRAMQIESEFVFPHLSRGYALIGLGRYNEALSSFQKAAELKEESTSRESAMLGQALCHYTLGEHDKAYALWRSAADKNADLKNIATLQHDHRWHDTILNIARDIIGDLYGNTPRF